VLGHYCRASLIHRPARCESHSPNRFRPGIADRQGPADDRVALKIAEGRTEQGTGQSVGARARHAGVCVLARVKSDFLCQAGREFAKLLLIGLSLARRPRRRSAGDSLSRRLDVRWQLPLSVGAQGDYVKSRRCGSLRQHPSDRGECGAPPERKEGDDHQERAREHL
jgi:hypothetical protein